MPIGIARQANCDNDAKQSVLVASGKGSWIVANDDAETAQSATDLLRPAGIDDDVFHWVKVGTNVTRALVRARMAVGATVAGNPIVRVIGAYGTPDTSGAFADDGTVRFLRLDNADANAAGLTLTLASSGTGLMQDGTYAYSDPMPDLTGIDLKGCNYVGVAVEDNADVNSGTVPIQLLFLN